MKWLFIFFTLLLSATPASADDAICPGGSIAGDWTNVRQELNVLSRIEIVPTCDENSPFGAWKVRAHEKCLPRDCSWGWVQGAFDDRGHFWVKFETFSAVRTMSLNPQSLRMRADVKINYRLDGKEDIEASYILVKTAK